MNYNPPVADISVNGRSYRFPKVPTVCVCIDGSEPGYIERAIEAGLAPNFARLMANGANLLASSVIPSFTNPNNLSIITGRPPAVHGIAGNYFFDPATGFKAVLFGNEAAGGFLQHLLLFTEREIHVLYSCSQRVVIRHWQITIPESSVR